MTASGQGRTADRAVVVRMSDAEFEVLDVHAQQAGESVAELLLRAAIVGVFDARWDGPSVVGPTGD